MAYVDRVRQAQHVRSASESAVLRSDDRSTFELRPLGLVCARPAQEQTTAHPQGLTNIYLRSQTSWASTAAPNTAAALFRSTMPCLQRVGSPWPEVHLSPRHAASGLSTFSTPRAWPSADLSIDGRSPAASAAGLPALAGGRLDFSPSTSGQTDGGSLPECTASAGSPARCSSCSDYEGFLL